jgi:transcriptional regulator with XRE-family HTH domain
MFDVLKRIDQLRENRGWSLRQIVQYTGIPQTIVDQWYSKQLIPSIVEIEKLCDAFEITLSDFFERELNKATETNLAFYRKKAGYSQIELAEKTGISVETICAYEQRKRDLGKAQYYTVNRIAQILGCPIQKLIG